MALDIATSNTHANSNQVVVAARCPVPGRAPVLVIPLGRYQASSGVALERVGHSEDEYANHVERNEILNYTTTH